MGCRCKGNGRLVISVYSDEGVVTIKLIDQSNYIDYYKVKIEDGKGVLLLENIHQGYLKVECLLNAITYEPSNIIYFNGQRYTHTLLITDRSVKK